MLIELRCRYTVRGDGKTNNNGELRLAYEEAASLLGLGKATLARAFRELEAAGFIAKTKPGHWYGRMATEWRVTDQNYKGALPTRDWQKARPKSERGTRAEHINPEHGPG
ncbi:hypothetical protein [Prosthecodimorpha staleyi]|uniref:Uncharacterized protein n=1 Tax=Prosthecodimorpha staleyi TaxID=2840188 RepID=A0A947D8B4_9HYPH|nr:hypothetical protein [Prosthecodimorpha staleyi]MBT9292963.1 hypothetical protein [Prosthecodimorpha staleyi]